MEEDEATAWPALRMMGGVLWGKTARVRAAVCAARLWWRSWHAGCVQAGAVRAARATLCRALVDACLKCQPCVLLAGLVNFSIPIAGSGSIGTGSHKMRS